jgi:phospholipase/lecithinase/hemolysin
LSSINCGKQRIPGHTYNRAMMRIRFLTLLFGAVISAATAAGSSFSAVVAYGDSLSDNGNLFGAIGQPGAPYYAGRASNGPVAVELLADIVGDPLLDFAWSGATTGLGNHLDPGGTATTVGVFRITRDAAAV